MSDPKNPSPNSDASKIVIVVLGAALVVVGLVSLARQWLWPGWLPVNLDALLSTIRGLGWGLGLIIIGILVIIVTQRKGFTPPAKGARLYRSRTNKVIGGVFGGLADYLSMDATVMRLIYAGLSLLFGLWPGIVAYIIATIIVPEEPKEAAEVTTAQPPVPPAPPAPVPPSPQPPVPPAPPAPQAPVTSVPEPPAASEPSVAEPPVPPEPPVPEAHE